LAGGPAASPLTKLTEDYTMSGIVLIMLGNGMHFTLIGLRCWSIEVPHVWLEMAVESPAPCGSRAFLLWTVPGEFRASPVSGPLWAGTKV
jgi:hypothetical protein